MANPRHQERSFESIAEQSERKLGEEATHATHNIADHATRNIADFTERATRTNVDMLQSGMETARHIWASSAELTSSLAKRSTDQLGRALGLAGGDTDATAQQTSRNISAIMHTSQALNEGLCKVSDEWFKFARTRTRACFRARGQSDAEQNSARAGRNPDGSSARQSRRYAALDTAHRGAVPANGARRITQAVGRNGPSGLASGCSSVQSELRAARKPPFLFSYLFSVGGRQAVFAA